MSTMTQFFYDFSLKIASNSESQRGKRTCEFVKFNEEIITQHYLFFQCNIFAHIRNQKMLNHNACMAFSCSDLYSEQTHHVWVLRVWRFMPKEWCYRRINILRSKRSRFFSEIIIINPKPMLEDCTVSIVEFKDNINPAPLLETKDRLDVSHDTFNNHLLNLTTCLCGCSEHKCKH